MTIRARSGLACGLLLVISSGLMTASAMAQTLPVGQADNDFADVLAVQFGVNGSLFRNVGSVDIPDDQDGSSTVGLPRKRSRYFGDLNASISYRPVQRGAFSFALSASSAARRYEGDTGFVSLGHSAGGSLGWEMTRRTSMAGFAGFTYLPSYSLDMMPATDLTGMSQVAGFLPVSAIDFSLSRQPAYGTRGGISLSQSLSRRASLSFTYTAIRSDFTAEDVPNLLSQNMAGRFAYSLSRNLSLRLGYGRRIADYTRPTGLERLTLDDIDAGIVFSKALSITRSTTFSFTTGSTMEQDEGARRFALTGTANLNQELGRKGNLALAYRRGGELREGFGRPVFADTLSLNGQWNLTQRLVAGAVAYGSLGNSGVSARDNGVSSIAASAQLGYQFSQRGRIYAQYLTYFQDIDEGVDFVSGIQREQRNRTIRVGLSLAIPLVSGMRQPVRPTLERN